MGRSSGPFGSREETLFEDVRATYKDGVLEVRCPYKVPTEAPPMKVEVARG